MPDISMCANIDCQKRLMCARFRAVPDTVRQSYIIQDHETCKKFWSIRDAGFKLDDPIDSILRNRKIWSKQNES